MKFPRIREGGINRPQSRESFSERVDVSRQRLANYRHDYVQHHGRRRLEDFVRRLGYRKNCCLRTRIIRLYEGNDGVGSFGKSITGCEQNLNQFERGWLCS